MSALEAKAVAIEQSGADTDRKSAATILVEIAEKSYRFGVSPDGETFAIPRSGPKVVATLRGNRSSLRGLLAREYFRRIGKAAPQQSLADALLVIDGLAQEQEPESLHLRVAARDGAQWLDLGDGDGRAVRITDRGWSIVKTPTVLFKRTALMSALPLPVPGGTLDELWRLLNVAEADRPLLAAWLVSTFYPEIAHPALTLLGEQGTGKSTAQRMIVMCVDASPVPSRKPPRDAESWVTAAAGSWLVGLDNLSEVQPWLSDSICRAVTGDGDVRRKLYTDGEHHVFAFRRCVLMNGIDLGATRGDLADRMLPIHLERIPDDARKLDSDIWPTFDKAHPRILGAVLDLVAGVAGLISSVRLESKPRMADFARIVAAVDKVLGTNGMRHYSDKQGALAVDSLSADAFIMAVQQHCVDGFHGTAAELLDKVTSDHPPRGWPGSPRTVTARLRRQAPVMRKAGWTVTDDDGSNHDKVLRWTVRPPARPEIARISSPQDPQSPHGAGLAGVAGIDCRPSQDVGPFEADL